MTDWHVILRVVVGSTAYGLARPGSDVDRLALAAAPTSAFHGLHPPTGRSASRVSVDPDDVTHEVGKACALMLGCNPTVLEALFLPETYYEVRTPLADELIRHRDAFLSQKAVRNAYLGYATQQFRRLSDRGDGTFSSDVRRRTEKHARHLKRLCEQGLQLYETGTMTVCVENPIDFFAFGRHVAANPHVGLKLIDETKERFERARATSPLPERPDEAWVEAWLRRVRAERWRAETTE